MLSSDMCDMFNYDDNIGNINNNILLSCQCYLAFCTLIEDDDV